MGAFFFWGGGGMFLPFGLELLRGSVLFDWSGCNVRVPGRVLVPRQIATGCVCVSLPFSFIRFLGARNQNWGGGGLNYESEEKERRRNLPFTFPSVPASSFPLFFLSLFFFFFFSSYSLLLLFCASVSLPTKDTRPQLLALPALSGQRMENLCSVEPH